MLDKLREIFSSFNRLLNENAQRSPYSMVAVGIIGSVAHCFYGLLWTQITPLEHENVWLRLVGAMSCFGLLINKHWPESWKRFLPWYWFAVVLYSLPFFATFQLFGSNYSALRSMLEVTMVFFVVIVFSQPVLIICNMVLGVALAAYAAALTIPNFSALNHGVFFSVHLHLLIYTLIGGLVFSRSNLRGLRAQEKVEVMKALMGSVANEVKAPLAQLTQRLEKMGTLLPNHVVGIQSQTIYVSDLEEMYTELAKCMEEIHRSKQVIDMTMDEIHAKPIDRSGHTYLSASATVTKALAEFSFAKASDRERITVLTNTDFMFKGDETRFIFTLFNLLKNAIYYFDQYPKASIVIRVNHQSVSVDDTGPGMKPEVYARVFEAFHSVGKPGGTGLGLSFCKRSMRAFGGDISCESVPGSYTRFVMSFPRVAPHELYARDENVKQRAIEIFTGKRILVVDDSRHFRNTTKKMLSVLQVDIDEAEDGNEALAKLAAQPYDAMLLDLSMPGLDGYATAEKVRAGAVPGLENLAIVAHSSESPHAARVRLERIGVNEFVSKGCSPLEMFDAMCRAHDASKRLAKSQEVGTAPSGKVVLLIEDDDFFRKYLRTALLAEGFRVQEAPNGQIALNLLNDASVTIDAVLTDIHMPGLDGFEIARTLRARALPQSALPVIALSAHCDDSMLSEGREAGISGFLTKPVKAAELGRVLSRHLDGGDVDGRQEEAVAASPAPNDPSLILDVTKLEGLRRMGLLADDLLQALNDARTQVEELAAHVKTMDFDQAKTLLHDLMGLTAQLGAEAAHGDTRARYVFMHESGNWPMDGNWLPQLGQRLMETERQLKAHLKLKR